MTIIKWILATLFALVILFNLTTIFDGDWIINAILMAIAVALVLPPLDPEFASRLSFLKSNALRIFLAVILAFAALIIGTTPALTLDSIALCPSSSADSCSAEMALFAEGPQPVTVKATIDANSLESVDALSIDITSLDTEDDSFTLNKVIEVEGDSTDVSLELDSVDLKVGTYEIEVTPEGTDEQTGLSKKQTFAVLASEENIAKRAGSEDGFSGFKDTIAELIVCADPGGDDHCDEAKTTLTTSEIVLADAVISNPDANYTWLGSGPELTFIWRIYPEGTDSAPEIFLQETIEVEENTGVYGFPIGIAEAGMPPGDYDVIALLETANSKPVRVPFTITQ